jgi:hypothetical protein
MVKAPDADDGLERAMYERPTEHALKHALILTDSSGQEQHNAFTAS